MTMPGITEEPDLKRLLKRLIEDQQEVFKFAVVARGPKDGDLSLIKKEKRKKKEVRTVAEARTQEQSGGKSFATKRNEWWLGLSVEVDSTVESIARIVIMPNGFRGINRRFARRIVRGQEGIAAKFP